MYILLVGECRESCWCLLKVITIIVAQYSQEYNYLFNELGIATSCLNVVSYPILLWHSHHSIPNKVKQVEKEEGEQK